MINWIDQSIVHSWYVSSLPSYHHTVASAAFCLIRYVIKSNIISVGIGIGIDIGIGIG